MPCVVYVNLKTPCPDWLGSAGKTHINLNPYADDIAKTVSSLAYKMPSYHGEGFTIKYESYLNQAGDSAGSRATFQEAKKIASEIDNDDDKSSALAEIA